MSPGSKDYYEAYNRRSMERLVAERSRTAKSNLFDALRDNDRDPLKEMDEIWN